VEAEEGSQPALASGFLPGLWWLWHHPGATLGPGAAVWSKGSCLPAGCSGALHQAAHPDTEVGSPSHHPSSYRYHHRATLPSLTPQPQLTCTARPSTRIPPLRAASSRKTRLVRGSTEYPKGRRVPGASQTGEGTRGWAYGSPGCAPGQIQGRGRASLVGSPDSPALYG